jgi:hypothetical protein
MKILFCVLFFAALGFCAPGFLIASIVVLAGETSYLFRRYRDGAVSRWH